MEGKRGRAKHYPSAQTILRPEAESVGIDVEEMKTVLSKTREGWGKRRGNDSRSSQTRKARTGDAARNDPYQTNPLQEADDIARTAAGRKWQKGDRGLDHTIPHARPL